MKLMTSVAFASGTAIENLPLASVLVPTVEPFISTLAPGIGFELSSVTLPPTRMSGSCMNWFWKELFEEGLKPELPFRLSHIKDERASLSWRWSERFGEIEYVRRLIFLK